MESVGNAAFGCKIYHCLVHIARTGKDEANVLCAFEHKCCSFHKVFGAFLHGDADEECNHLLLRVLYAGYCVEFGREGINGIVHRYALAGVLVVVVDNSLSCQLRYAHDAVGMIHTVLFY